MKGKRTGDHETRKMLTVHIRSDPGISFRELMNLSMMNEGTLRYHLDMLLKQGEINTKKMGNKRVFYIGKMPHIPTQPAATDVSRNRSRVLDLISRSPGITRNEILGSMDISRSDLSSILSSLQKDDLIWKAREDGREIYERVTEDRVLDRMLLELARMFLDDRIDETTFLRLKNELEKR